MNSTRIGFIAFATFLAFLGIWYIVTSKSQTEEFIRKRGTVQVSSKKGSGASCNVGGECNTGSCIKNKCA